MDENDFVLIAKPEKSSAENITKVTIDWVRHAESCANLDGDSYLDRNPSSLPNLVPTPSQIKATAKYHPNLSFIGMQQAILLGSEYSKDKKYDAIFVSASLRSIMTAMMALRGCDCVIHVIPYITEHINLAGKIDKDYQNKSVPPEILKRLVLYVKDWLENNWIKYFDDIMLIEKLNKLKKFYVYKNLPQQDIILIDTILSCKTNIDKKQWLSRQNYYLKTNPDLKYESWYKDCVDKIMFNISILTDALESEINTYDTKLLRGKEIHTGLKPYYDFLINIRKPQFIRGPPVDFTYWEKYQDDTTKLTQDEIFNKFYTDFLPQYIKDHNKLKYNFMCVSHGSIMRNYFKTKYPDTKIPGKNDMYNTQVCHEEFDFNILLHDYTITNNNINCYQYVPKKIRTNEKYKDLELQNINICRTESLKGMLNYPIWDIEKSSGFQPTLGIGQVINFPLNTYATIDNQFLFEKDGTILKNNKYYKESDKTIITGGSKHKYEKYKAKYLQLKLSKY